MEERLLRLVERIAAALETIASEITQIADALDDLRPPRHGEGERW